MLFVLEADDSICMFFELFVTHVVFVTKRQLKCFYFLKLSTLIVIGCDFFSSLVDVFYI